MCGREGSSLQRGMNFRLGKTYSVILMSVRPNAPYRDRIENDGATLIYEGHDVPRSPRTPNPKAVDQPEFTPAGSLTENGKFLRAAQAAQQGHDPEAVRVYEKIKEGIWSYNGTFSLVKAWREKQGRRTVLKFQLELLSNESTDTAAAPEGRISIGRIIPKDVKLEVWKRDHGRCVLCGAANDLHFDHILPHSKGGTSITAENVQILCARHNLSKSARIE